MDGIQNKKQEAHTKMWGTKTRKNTCNGEHADFPVDLEVSFFQTNPDRFAQLRWQHGRDVVLVKGLPHRARDGVIYDQFLENSHMYMYIYIHIHRYTLILINY